MIADTLKAMGLAEAKLGFEMGDSAARFSGELSFASYGGVA